MKICIPSETDAGHASSVHPHFGRAPFFSIVDLETGDLRVVKNPRCHQHGQHCHHLPILKAHGVDTVLATHMGHRALDNLRAAGLQVLHAPVGTVDDLIAAVRDGKCRSDFPRPRDCRGAGHGRCHGSGNTHGHGHGTGTGRRRAGSGD